MNPYLIVTGDLVETGGMDKANLALARYLAEQGREVHLVAHRVDPELLKHPGVHFHAVPKVANSYFLASALLRRAGRHWARIVSQRGGHVIVNGGNCDWAGINWVHYVHAAHEPGIRTGVARRNRIRWMHRSYLRQERAALRRAKLTIANSKRTESDLIQNGLTRGRVQTIYCGIDAEKFRPSNETQRRIAREKLGIPQDQPLLTFVGQLGDLRKGFSSVFEAFSLLCRDPKWAANLLVAGSGADLPYYKQLTREHNLEARILFLGLRHDMPGIFSASDALIAPTRYEAFGMAVHEALACGLPSLVSRKAGVAELYPPELDDLLLDDPADVRDLAHRMRRWLDNREHYRQVVRTTSDQVRQYTWDHMSARIMELIEATS